MLHSSFCSLAISFKPNNSILLLHSTNPLFCYLLRVGQLCLPLLPQSKLESHHKEITVPEGYKPGLLNSIFHRSAWSSTSSPIWWHPIPKLRHEVTRPIATASAWEYMEIESSSLTESVSRDDLREVWGVEGRSLSCFASQRSKRIVILLTQDCGSLIRRSLSPHKK
jgi:hypothetical protein